LKGGAAFRPLKGGAAFQVKLFHCIVVMGAAMGSGCGPATLGPENREGPGTDGGTGLSAAPFDLDAACSSASLTIGFGCSSSCRGTPDAPSAPRDCPFPQQLECDGAACACDPTAPLGASDCAETGQFTCDDWSALCGCRCNTGAVLDAAACCGDDPIVVGPTCFDENATLSWSCESYDPPIGCDCRRIGVTIL
jgi:hypothetical protein